MQCCWSLQAPSTPFVVQSLRIEGRTGITTRMDREAVRFSDSADGICQREPGGASFLCPGAKVAVIADKFRKQPIFDGIEYEDG